MAGSLRFENKKAGEDTGLFLHRDARPRKVGKASCASDQGDQEARAARARSVISSTLPVPLMARYFGAAAASALAQLL